DPHRHPSRPRRRARPGRRHTPRKLTTVNVQGDRMPTATSRRRIELPVDIYAALTQAAAAKGIPTAALASVWLRDRLRQERPDLYTNPNTYRYRGMHARRPDAGVYQWGPAPAPREGEEVIPEDEELV